MRTKIPGLIVCLYVLLLIVSCAHLPVGLGGEDTLRKQVRLEWDAKVGNNWGAVYDVCVKAFKDAIPRENFIKRCNLQVGEYSIKEVEMVEPGEKAIVTVMYQVNQMGYVFEMTTEEEWIREDGKWRLNLSPSVMKLPFMKTN